MSAPAQPMQPAMQPQQQVGGLQVCAACGAILVNGACDRCGGRQGVVVPAPEQGVHWVQLRLAIGCATCQRRSPLARLDMEGRFYCYGCGRDMFFDADLWKEYVLNVASALGDAYWASQRVFTMWPNVTDVDEIAGSDEIEELCDDAVAAHLLKKCMEIGRTTGGLTLEKGGMTIGAGGMRTSACAFEMSPGHPLCTKCKTPLSTRVEPDGVASTVCSRCGVRESYRLPPAARSACNDLCGVISTDHVDGRENARVAAQGAAIAAVCPKCGSGLQLAPGSRVAQCGYCKTTCVVPEMIALAGAQPGQPEPFWLAFRSPSAVRAAILAAATSAANEAAEEAEEEARERRANDDRESARQREREAQGRAARTGQIVGLVVPFGVAAVVGGAFLFTHSDAFHHGEKDKHEGHGDQPTTTATATATPKRTDPVAIPSCTCSFGGDGQTSPRITVTLEAPPTGGSAWALDIERQSGFVSEGSTVRLKTRAGALLPPTDAAPTKLGMACDTGVVVLVADKVATGWSSVNAAWKWNTTLPSPAVEAADAGTSPIAGSDYAGGCTPLAVKNGATALTLANGKHVTLSLKDGKVR